MNQSETCRHGVDAAFAICEDCILDGNDAHAPEPLGILNAVPVKPDWGAIQDAKNAFMARHYRRDTGHPGSKAKVAVSDRKASRKRERQARKAGRR